MVTPLAAAAAAAIVVHQLAGKYGNLEVDLVLVAHRQRITILRYLTHMRLLQGTEPRKHSRVLFSVPVFLVLGRPLAAAALL